MWGGVVHVSVHAYAEARRGQLGHWVSSSSTLHLSFFKLCVHVWMCNICRCSGGLKKVPNPLKLQVVGSTIHRCWKLNWDPLTEQQVLWTVGLSLRLVCLLKQCFPPKPSVQLGWLGSESLSQCSGTGSCRQASLFTLVLGLKIRSSCCRDSPLSHWVIFPAHSLQLF